MKCILNIDYICVFVHWVYYAHIDKRPDIPVNKVLYHFPFIKFQLHFLVKRELSLVLVVMQFSSYLKATFKFVNGFCKLYSFKYNVIYSCIDIESFNSKLTLAFYIYLYAPSLRWLNIESRRIACTENVRQRNGKLYIHYMWIGI